MLMILTLNNSRFYRVLETEMQKSNGFDDCFGCACLLRQLSVLVKRCAWTIAAGGAYFLCSKFSES
jgi:hypothetical protein